MEFSAVSSDASASALCLNHSSKDLLQRSRTLKSFETAPARVPSWVSSNKRLSSTSIFEDAKLKSDDIRLRRCKTDGSFSPFESEDEWLDFDFEDELESVKSNEENDNYSIRSASKETWDPLPVL